MLAAWQPLAAALPLASPACCSPPPRSLPAASSAADPQLAWLGTTERKSSLQGAEEEAVQAEHADRQVHLISSQR